MICSLIGVFATMIWPTQLVTTCQYKCPEQSPRFYLNVHRPYGSQCEKKYTREFMVGYTSGYTLDELDLQSILWKSNQ